MIVPGINHPLERRRRASLEEGRCPCDGAPLSPTEWRLCGACGCQWKIDDRGRCVVARSEPCEVNFTTS